MKTKLALPWSVLAGLALASELRAHAPAAPSGGASGWLLWNFDPLIVFNLIVLAALYAVGWTRLRRQRGEDAPLQRRHAVAYAAGLVFVAIALLSPVDVLAGDLQWMHMVQHMVLMNLAAPLFVLGSPGRAMLWALPVSGRKRMGLGRKALTRHGMPRYLFWQPVGLWLLYAFVLWVWHLPVLYEAALHDEWVHDFQHLTFFAASALFWRVLFDPIGRLRLAHAPAVLYLFLTSLHATVLGVFMALAPRLWYPYYAGRTATWGIPALEDQQLAGYIMWMPACMAYAVIAAAIFAEWLTKEQEPPSAAARTPAG